MSVGPPTAEALIYGIFPLESLSTGEKHETRKDYTDVVLEVGELSQAVSGLHVRSLGVLACKSALTLDSHTDEPKTQGWFWLQPTARQMCPHDVDDDVRRDRETPTTPHQNWQNMLGSLWGNSWFRPRVQSPKHETL